MPKVIENKLIDEFKDREAFSRAELFDFYKSFEPDLKEGTLGWRIYDLKERNIINTIKRGLYTISRLPEFRPKLTPDLVKLGKQIAGKFEDVKFSVWETSWLNEFLQHQSGQAIILVEVERGFEESLYFNVKDNFKHEAFLNPSSKEINLYVAESKRPIVIRKLITRSPLNTRMETKTEVQIPTLEKILVDVFAEEELFYHLQGSEMIHVYENAMTNYAINFTRLFSYAKRREREQGIKGFLTTHLPHLVKGVIDD